MKSYLYPLAITAMTLSLPVSAAIVSGDVLVFDVGPSASGSETAGNWNNLSGSSSSVSPITDAIRFSDGASTGVGLALSGLLSGKVGIGGIDDVTGPSNFSSPGFIGSGAIPETAYQDLAYFSNEDGANSFTFSGLDNSLSYTLSFISRVNAGTERPSLTWDIGEGQASVAIDPENNTNIYSFSGLSTDGLGKLVVSIPISGSDTAHLNAIELIAIPEPSAFSLVMGFCVLSFLGLRRR
ncbi:hypothetical protein [Thalassobacterium maritimum]|nr:hypothetical protein [Coraliomargarita sp. SDUM461003]